MHKAHLNPSHPTLSYFISDHPASRLVNKPPHFILYHTSPHPAAPQNASAHRAIPYVTIHTIPFCPRLAHDVTLQRPITPGYLIPCCLTLGHPLHILLLVVHIGPVSCNTTLCHINILFSRQGLSMESRLALDACLSLLNFEKIDMAHHSGLHGHAIIYHASHTKQSMLYTHPIHPIQYISCYTILYHTSHNV